MKDGESPVTAYLAGDLGDLGDGLLTEFIEDGAILEVRFDIDPLKIAHTGFLRRLDGSKSAFAVSQQKSFQQDFCQICRLAVG